MHYYRNTYLPNHVQRFDWHMYTYTYLAEKARRISEEFGLPFPWPSHDLFRASIIRIDKGIVESMRDSRRVKVLSELVKRLTPNENGGPTVKINIEELKAQIRNELREEILAELKPQPKPPLRRPTSMHQMFAINFFLFEHPDLHLTATCDDGDVTVSQFLTYTQAKAIIDQTPELQAQLVEAKKKKEEKAQEEEEAARAKEVVEEY